MSRSVIKIKKYPNRRLYNTEESSYITVKNVAELIKKGCRVEVIDETSGEDVTAIILTQIIMNKAKENNELLPVSLLHLVIQFGESHLHDFFDKYLERTIENYLHYRKNIDDQMNAYLGIKKDISNLTEKTLMEMDTFNLFRDTSKKHTDDK